MTNYVNPFEYEAASKLTSEQLVAYYSEDFNYSRFVESKKNIFLVGERGTGKTMALLYHSLPVKKIKAQKEKQTLDLSMISVYVPCNTPLFHRQEHDLLDHLHASLVSEHCLVVSIMREVVETVSGIKELFDSSKVEEVRDEIAYVLSLKLPDTPDLFRALSLAFDKYITTVQKVLNEKSEEAHLAGLMSFSSGLRPLLTCLTHIPMLSDCHFSLMIDDVQHLNPYQMRALNSWIAYRDNTLFSFKVTATRVEAPSLETSFDGSILEGHDFTRIDMEQPYQNRLSAFGKMAREIIKKRLNAIDVKKTPDDFFPISESFEKDLQNAKNQAMEEAKKKFPQGSQKQISDYVYKYKRAIYFRNRDSRSNLPPYSGFELLVHLSTGVIRNLLDPCWYMYDRVYSERHAKNETGKIIINEIPASTQDIVIKERSRKKWEWMKEELPKTIDGCSHNDAKRVYQLIDNLAILFKKRLQKEISEPRAVVFTISEYSEVLRDKLESVLKIARKAQLLYTFTSSAKDLGMRETYYMPNRILWPERGLDPQGQHARVSIKAQHLWNAADKNKKIPFKEDDKGDELSLFNFAD